jgi:Tol biopolymer transport system component/DNA-binding winged helix-turn-helix (wHTH) protein
MAPAHRVRFGPFELDLRTNELRKGGRRVRVHDQPLQILRALLDRAGDVVTRDELRARLWPADTFVDFDHGVNSAVRRLRDALGDTADRPKYIETLPRRGYRFIGTIDVDDIAATAPALVDSPAGAPPAAPALSTETPPAATRVVASAARPWSRRWLVVAAALLAIALSALALVGRWSDRPPSPSPAWHEAARLTFDDGLQTDPSFSPDGASIAYASNAAGAFDIWTQRIATDGRRVGAPTRVTTHAADDSQPDWSPDGNSIVFRSERGAGGIFVAPATGGVEVQVADFGYRPQWSPDGRLIVFASSLVAGLNGVLHVIAPNERTPRPLRAPGVSGGGFGWRPGSHEVVILNAFRVPFNIVLVGVDVETSESVRWTFDQQVIDGFREQTLIVPGERLRWSEDGRTMYFIGESRGLRSLWRVEVDAAAHRVVGGPIRVTSTARDANNFAVSRDGHHIAFDGSTRAARLWAYELDGAGGVREGREQPVSLEAAHAEGPDLSPDGQSLVSMQSQPGSRQRLEIVARDMATGRDRVLRTVDDDRENVAFVRWSGRGTRLSYLHTVRSAAGSHDQVRLLDPATDHDEALTSQRTASTTMADLAGDWTFDDTAVVASSKRYVDGHDAIVLLPLAAAPRAETSAVVVTSVRQGDIYQVSASPDGRWITFRAASTPGLPGSRIAVVSTSARGSDETSWIIAAGTERWSVDKPRWSTSSDRIYFTGTDGGPLSVWSIGFDSARGVVTGPPRQALALNSPDAYLLPDIRELELAVGGNRLVVPIVRPTGGIWIAERER